MQTILVKKKDGSFVRMTLDELKRMKAVQKDSAQPKVVPSAPVEDAVDYTGITFQNRTGSHLSSAEERAGRGLAGTIQERDIYTSLLEEKEPEIAKALPRVSQSREIQAEEVIKKLSFTVARENSNRLRTILQLKLKDVRSEEQTREVLMRREIDGGLGLTNSQSDEIISFCHKSVGNKASEESVPALKLSLVKPKTSTALIKSESHMLEKFLPASTPATSAPNNAFIHGNLNPDKVKLTKEAVVKTFSAPPEPMPFIISNEWKKRTTMQDVAPKPLEITPVDEIHYFTLTDFRRLSSNPEESAKRLKQKFINLKEESVLLYLDALRAWRDCPFYTEYIAMVAGLLCKEVNQLSIANDKKKIQLPEIKALVGMEKELEYL